jgi:very-short-patch-repair endonuclease
MTERIAWFDRTGAADKKARRPRPPAQPKQGEMTGMETCDAAKVLIEDQRRRERKREKATPEDLFAFDLERFRLPKFQRYVQFAREVGRKFEADFLNREHMLIVEVEGLVVRRLPGGDLVLGGRHASIGGFKEDCVKYAIAAQLGYTVLRFEQSQVTDGTAIDYTQKVLAAKGWRR